MPTAQKKLTNAKSDQVAKPDWRLYGNVQNSGVFPWQTIRREEQIAKEERPCGISMTGFFNLSG